MHVNRRAFFGIVIGAFASKFYKPAPILGTWGAVVRSKVPQFRSVLYGGAAGGGKTTVMNMKMLIHSMNYNMGARLRGVENPYLSPEYAARVKKAFGVK